MAVKQLYELARLHPLAASAGLFACVLVGTFGAGVYVQVNEQRVALMDQRLKQQEDLSKQQKEVNDVINRELLGLREGISSLPTTLRTIKDTVGKLITKRTSSIVAARELESSIARLETDIGKIEQALRQTEAITKAYRSLLTSAEAGRAFDVSEYVSALQGARVSLDELAKVGRPVANKELRPGDLVFFNALRNVSADVGIYVGDNKIIKGSSIKGAARLVDLGEAPWNSKYAGARRIIQSQDSELADQLSDVTRLKLGNYIDVASKPIVSADLAHKAVSSP